MEFADAVRIVHLRWPVDGKCVSCGARRALIEYGELATELAIDERLSQLQLRCLADDDGKHWGVRIRIARERRHR